MSLSPKGIQVHGDGREESVSLPTDRRRHRRRLLGGLFQRIELQWQERRRRVPIFEWRERVGFEQQFWLER